MSKLLPSVLLQTLLEDVEGKMEALMARLYEEGSDPSVAAKLMEDKEEGDAKIKKLYQEVGWGFKFY